MKRGKSKGKGGEGKRGGGVLLISGDRKHMKNEKGDQNQGEWQASKLKGGGGRYQERKGTYRV